MTPETDPRQEVETVVTPGKGVRLPAAVPAQIDLTRRLRDESLLARHPARHGLPAMQAEARPASPAERVFTDLPTYEIGEAPPAMPLRDMSDEQSEAWSDDALRGSIATGSAWEAASRPGRTERPRVVRPAPGRRERFVFAVAKTLATALGVAR